MKNFLNWLSTKKGFRTLLKERRDKKALSFRVFATLGTFSVAFVLTGNPIGSVSIATAQAVTNTLIYREHEKYWDGAENKKLQEIKKEIEKPSMPVEYRLHPPDSFL